MRLLINILAVATLPKNPAFAPIEIDEEVVYELELSAPFGSVDRNVELASVAGCQSRDHL